MRRHRGVVPLACLLLGACASPPPCPPILAPDSAPSAGCLVLVHGRMLVVENLRGKVSPPGGKTEPGESAQCAAHREAWEETGLDVLPGPLLHTFDTGFNLYQCGIHAQSGQIGPHAPDEVRRAYWLRVEDFGTVEWRFPGQDEELHTLLLELHHQQQEEAHAAVP
jgi:8-oxo-dGTP diphosphatase